MSNEQFEKSIENLKQELGSLHTNRATPALVENVPVLAYESTMKLQEVASIAAPEPQTLTIQPWDKTLLKAIESALRDSELQIEPIVDGDMVRIAFPPLTEERRKELVKLVNDKVENARVSIRKTREDILKDLKDQQKAGEISEDDYFREEKEVQQTVDTYNENIKAVAEAKETELMTV